MAASGDGYIGQHWRYNESRDAFVPEGAVGLLGLFYCQIGTLGLDIQ
jgi:hypothetical protein